MGPEITPGPSHCRSLQLEVGDCAGAVIGGQGQPGAASGLSLGDLPVLNELTGGRVVSKAPGSAGVEVGFIRCGSVEQSACDRVHCEAFDGVDAGEFGPTGEQLELQWNGRSALDQV